ncbi:MAG: hypothetical protein CR967_01945 [Proteobacteria bacterium]|nr:MAG: hypothetical protein CR967_01945 [Pseudomonadota bacterium]
MWAFLFGFGFCEERSAFGAGDLESSSPYGLTDSEKVLLKTKERMSALSKQLDDIQFRLSTLEEQMEGVRSVFDGTNERVNGIDRRLARLEDILGLDGNATPFSSQISDIQAHVDKNNKIQSSNNKEIKKVIGELGSLIDSINADYVSKKKFSDLESRLNRLEKSKQVSKEPKKSVPKPKGKSNFEIFSQAQKLYDKGKISKAKIYFESSVANNFKPAYSNFMLGEIAYKKKQWSSALGYYKKSVELFDKATYMPTLLYHTAISFDKIGDKQNANKFYKALKQGYPSSKEAKSL